MGSLEALGARRSVTVRRERLFGSRANLPTCFSRLTFSPTSVYRLLMHKDVSDDQALQKCDICEAPMVLVSTLAAMGTFPMQRIYKCTVCKFVVAETVKPASLRSPSGLA
jgi:hypothetical protein